MVKVLLVDDHSLLREALGSQLDQIEDLEVVGGVSSAEELLNTFTLETADVILMDIMMSGMTGLEATRWIKEQFPEVKVIIISSEIRKDYVTTGIKCGIDGYLTKDVGKDVVVDAIRTVIRGGKYFNEAITCFVFEDFYNREKGIRKRDRQSVSGLTKRENEVLEHVANGRTNLEVASTLFISVKTVETHKANILVKLGLKNTVELVKYAIKNKIIVIE